MREREFEIFNRDGKCFVRNTNTGTVLPMSAFQAKCKFQAEVDEIEKETTLGELGRQVCTRSLDVPDSVEARLVPIDYKSARDIRNCLMPILNDEPKEDWNFYTGRMAQAIAYVAGRRGFERNSDEWRDLQSFLWMVWKNWRDGKAAETIAALGISPDAYRMRIARLQAEFDDPEWAAYLICCAVSYGVKLRQKEERQSDDKPKGGILLPDWL